MLIEDGQASLHEHVVVRLVTGRAAQFRDAGLFGEGDPDFGTRTPSRSRVTRVCCFMMGSRSLSCNLLPVQSSQRIHADIDTRRIQQRLGPTFRQCEARLANRLRAPCIALRLGKGIWHVVHLAAMDASVT